MTSVAIQFWFISLRVPVARLSLFDLTHIGWSSSRIDTMDISSSDDSWYCKFAHSRTARSGIHHMGNQQHNVERLELFNFLLLEHSFISFLISARDLITTQANDLNDPLTLWLGPCYKISRIRDWSLINFFFLFFLFSMEQMMIEMKCEWDTQISSLLYHHVGFMLTWDAIAVLCIDNISFMLNLKSHFALENSRNHHSLFTRSIILGVSLVNWIEI